MAYDELIEIIKEKSEEGINAAIEYGNGRSHAILAVVHIIQDAIEEYPELLTQAEGDKLRKRILKKHRIIE